MGKAIPDAVLDAILDAVAAGTSVSVCSAEPSTRAEAVTTYMLATVTVDSGDFSKADHSTSGRELTVAAQSGLTVSNTGTATHVAITDATNVLAVWTCTSLALTAAEQVNVPAFTMQVEDPA